MSASPNARCWEPEVSAVDRAAPIDLVRHRRARRAGRRGIMRSLRSFWQFLRDNDFDGMGDTIA